MTKPLIRRVTLRNYKSIAACQVALGPLMFLVGPNGAGKSNFLDALAFVAQALNTTLDFALSVRGGIGNVRRRSGGHPTHFSIRLDVTLPDGRDALYAFRIGAKPNGGFEIQEEICEVGGHPEPDASFYHVQLGKIVGRDPSFAPPAIRPNHLLLVAASGHPNFGLVFDALSRIVVYNFDPHAMKLQSEPNPDQLLHRDGGNAPSIVGRLAPDVRDEIARDLSLIVKGVSGIDHKILGTQETIEFRQTVQGQSHPWRFDARSMSDGTLRALGVLIAVKQKYADEERETFPLTVALEEPETALHPYAAKRLLSALEAASEHRQILVTSHGADLLDNDEIPTDALLAIDHDQGKTQIGPIDEATKKTLKERLFTAGELLRMGQIHPAAGTLDDVRKESQLHLFDFAG